MPTTPKLNHPWLVAVWPGMGHVAANAGIYLLAKLGMHVIAEYEAQELFDVDQVFVKNGIVQPPRRPRNRFFLWSDPKGQRDLVVFLGEAQPPVGKYQFCRRLIAFAKELGVERVFTFAAMATDMHPARASRVFAAATDKHNLDELKRLELEVLEDGNVGGLNGVLLGVAAESGLQGACILGEMPHVFSQLPFPKASMAILEVFTTMASIEIDFAELAEQAQIMEQRLGEVLSRVEEAFRQQTQSEEEGYVAEAPPEARVPTPDQERIEALFELAEKDRVKAFELKQELDRLGLFKEYEDRFLDLFKKNDQ